jgi:hypothetical protein
MDDSEHAAVRDAVADVDVNIGLVIVEHVAGQRAAERASGKYRDDPNDSLAPQVSVIGRRRGGW